MHIPSARLFRLLAALAIGALACSGCYDLESINETLGMQQPAATNATALDDTTPAEDDAPAQKTTRERPSKAKREDARRTADTPTPAPTATDDTAPRNDGANKSKKAKEPEQSTPAPKATKATNDGQTASNATHGAGRTGPAAESCTSSGSQVSGASGLSGGKTSLLRAGTYQSLEVPAGATVKPYNCGKVTINGTVSLGNGATLAGVTVRSDAQWVLKIGGRDITVRNNTVEGGAVEAIRIHDNAKNVRLVGNNLDGGRNNHVVKVKSESGANPDDIVIDNNVFSKRYYGSSSEDLLQLEGHRHVTVTNNTFADNPRGEDGVDVKQGSEGMLMRGNRFVGGSINAECLLVQGSYAKNVVIDNVFENCGGVSLGAHPEAKSMPWWRFENNTLSNSMLRLRRSDKAEIVDNTMRGGLLKLGISSNADDTPRNLRIEGTTFNGVEINNNIRHSYTCVKTQMIAVTGDKLSCSG